MDEPASMSPTLHPSAFLLRDSGPLCVKHKREGAQLIMVNAAISKRCIIERAEIIAVAEIMDFKQRLEFSQFIRKPKTTTPQSIDLTEKQYVEFMELHQRAKALEEREKEERNTVHRSIMKLQERCRMEAEADDGEY